MKRWRNSALGLALLCGAAGIALGQQQESPESLLPPGFGDPVPAAPAPAPGAPAPGQPPVAPPPGAQAPVTIAAPEPIANELTPEEEAAAAEELERANIPDWARRDPNRTGPLPAGQGFGADAFGQASGRFLSGLMRRVEAPIASRWASIALRRALLTRVATPRRVTTPNWVAERAWLLLRMGEADAARMLVATVDADRLSPKLVGVAAQTALATADPAALCPLTPFSPPTSDEPIWPLATAMCTALGGEGATAGGMIDRARRQRVARGIDLLLAEKVMAAGSGRRAITIEWDAVDRLTAWRYGLATALAVPIPSALFETVGPHVLAWHARAAMVPLADRVAAARTAAALGVFSNMALVDLYGAIGDETDPAEIGETDAGRLRLAYVAEDRPARLAALRALWVERDSDGANERDVYAGAILTARAAARIAPDDGDPADAAALIGAMFSAGLDYQAARWAPIVEADDGGASDAAWSILAVGTPRRVVDVSTARVEAFAGRAEAHKARMLVASLAALGRLPLGEAQRIGAGLGINLNVRNAWTRALDDAAARGETGTVALIAAAGMQTPSWRGVPPAHLFHMLRAMVRAGMDGEARMIAAEAMTRL